MVLEMDPCSRFERWLTPYVDGELDAVHTIEVEDHLARCEECAERVAWTKALHKSLRRVARQNAPAGLYERVCAALRERAELDATGRDLAFTQAKENDATVEAEGASNVARVVQAIGHRAGGRKVSAARRARPWMVGLRYGLPMAAAAAAAAVFVSFGQGEDPARLSAVAVETTLDRASGADLGAEGAVASRADRARIRVDRSRITAGGARSGASAVRLVDEPSPRLDEPIELGAHDESAEPVEQSGSPQLVAAPEKETAPAWTVLGVPPSENVASRSLATLETIIEDLVVNHAQPLPPETTDSQGLERFDRFVGVRVAKPPHYEALGARYVGARLHPVSGGRAVMLQYVMGKSNRVTLYVFDSQRVPMRARMLKPRHFESKPAYVGQLRGYTVAASESNGVGYALATDLDSEQSTKLVLAAAQH